MQAAHFEQVMYRTAQRIDTGGVVGAVKQDERRIDNALQTACDTRTRQTAHSGLDRNVPAAQTQGINRAERVEAF